MFGPELRIRLGFLKRVLILQSPYKNDMMGQLRPCLPAYRSTVLAKGVDQFHPRLVLDRERLVFRCRG